MVTIKDKASRRGITTHMLDYGISNKRVSNKNADIAILAFFPAR